MALQEVAYLGEDEQRSELVGASIRRIDSLQKVRGSVIYPKDIQIQGMLYAKIKRCAIPHARIKLVDLSGAESINGTKAAISGKNFPMLNSLATPPLAREEVLYAGQGVAAVASTDSSALDRAIEAIETEYDELHAVLDPEEAILDHIRVRTSESRSNIGAHLKVRKGEADTAFKSADRIVESNYSTALETHFQLEPLTFVARPDPDGGITVWCTSSGSHRIKFSLSQYLQMDPHLIRVKIPLVGGWFGQREEAHVAAVCCLLALKSQRPVKLELSREETISITGARHPSRIHVRDALTKEGRVSAREIKAVYDGGAYGGSSLIRNSILAAISVYDIPVLKMDVYRVFTNRVPGASKRAPIGTQMVWAVESHTDYVASTLGKDPIKFRLLHFLHEGRENAIGENMSDISHDRCLIEVSQALSWNSEKAERFDVANENTGPWRRGRGVAVAAKWAPMGIPVQVSVRMRETGKVEISADLIEVGQGIYTSIAQIAAEELGIPISDVILLPFVNGSDSSSSGFATGASGSRQLVNIGNALLLAIQDAKNKIASKASARLGVPVERIEVRSGLIFEKTNRQNSIKISDLFTKFSYTSTDASFSQEDFSGTATVFKKEGMMDKETGRCIGGPIASYYESVAQSCEVAVNIETGEVRVEKFIAAMDVGKAINPELVKGQIIGSVAMGLSAALQEELIIENGRIVNANLTDYKILSSLDAPRIKALILETPHPGGPFGAKSAGEASILPTAACIRNAIHDAVGIWLNELPMTPSRVLLALQNRDN